MRVAFTVSVVNSLTTLSAVRFLAKRVMVMVVLDCIQSTRTLSASVRVGLGTEAGVGVWVAAGVGTKADFKAGAAVAVVAVIDDAGVDLATSVGKSKKTHRK